MNYLRRAREKKGLTQLEAVKAIRGVDKRVDVPLLSKYENGVALPTPPEAAVLCEIYQTDMLELYKKKDIDLLSLCKKTQERRRDRNGEILGKITIRVSAELASRFNGQAKALHMTQAQYLTYMVDAMEKKRKKKSPRVLEHHKGAKENIQLQHTMEQKKLQEGAAYEP